MWNRFVCWLSGHKYLKFKVGYQALNSDGIAYHTKCERCDQKASANFAYGVDINNFEDKKKLSKYVEKFGFTY